MLYQVFFLQAILNLGGPQFKQRCEDLKDRILNNNDKEILVELRNSQKESSQVPKALQSKRSIDKQLSELSVLLLGISK